MKPTHRLTHLLFSRPAIGLSVGDITPLCCRCAGYYESLHDADWAHCFLGGARIAAAAAMLCVVRGISFGKFVILISPTCSLSPPLLDDGKFTADSVDSVSN